MTLTTLTNLNYLDVVTGESRSGLNILIEDGLIVEISTRSAGEVIDLAGSFVLPGLIDAHVHLAWDGDPDPIRKVSSDPAPLTAYRAAQAARLSLRGGVTTVRDVGGPGGIPIALAAAVREGLVDGADVLAAGSPIVQTGGHVHQISVEADGPDEVRKAVRAQVKAGADLIKVMASGGAYTPGESIHATQLTIDELRTAAEEAHASGHRIAAHALNQAAIRNALDAGCDTVEHGAMASGENLDQFVETGAWLIPTLTPYYYMAERGARLGVPAYAVKKSEEVMEKYLGTLTRAFERGVNIGLGTDAGSPSTPHPCVPFEAWIWHREAGIATTDVLRAATLGAANALGLNDRGVITEGLRADLVAYDSDPLTNIDVLHAPRLVVKAGKVHRNTLTAWTASFISGR